MSRKNGHLDAVTQELHQLPVPMGWLRTTVDDLGEIRLGRQRSPKNRSKDHPTKYLRAANITWNGIDLNDVLDMEFQPHELETYRLKTGDVLLSEASGSAAEVGKPALWAGGIDDCCFQNTVIRFRPSEAVQPRYAYLAFLHFARNRVFSQVAKGVGIHHLSADRFSAIPFLLPPVAEQERIVVRADELLTELDAGVAALKRVQANLKRYRASVLKSAVEGKLTDEWRAEHVPKETGQQLLDRILKERRQRWEAEQLAAYEAKGKQPPKDWQARYKQPDAPDMADLSTLPEGWCWAAVNQVGDVKLGRQRSPKHHSGPHMRPYLRVANVFEDRIDTSDVMEMNFTPAEFETFSLNFGDILLNEGQSFELVGRPAMYRDEVPGACFTNTLVRFRASEGLNRDFALRVFLAYLKSKRFQKIATITVNIAHLGAGRFAEIEFPLPPKDEQAEVVRLVDELFTQIDAAEKFVEQGLLRASRLRQSILKDAFEGRLVAQDPADEPASELLARIKAARRPVVQKSASTTPPRRVPKEITHRRAAVVAYMISHIDRNGSTAKPADSMGRTKLVKALYIAQTHEELDLQFRFQRYAAGPFDEALFKLEGTAKKNEWFITKERDHFGVTYHAAPKTEPMSQQAAKFLGDNRASFDRLLGHIDTMDMQQAELFATAYAAWNDLLIDGRKITDDAIIDEFYAWDDSKQKFSQAAILKELKWMRSAGYVPSGKGERTQPRDKKTKLPSRKRRKT